jgi:predicted amidohydrolase YtcJ
MDPSRPPAGAIAMEDGRITRVEGAPGLGPCVLPAFVDAHVHFPSWAITRVELRLFDVTTLDEAVARVATAKPAADGWIRGRGWRDELWAAKPTRQALDAVQPETPVALRAHDGHSLWLNSAALRNRTLPDEPVVERDADGEPTGVLREEAAWAFFAEHAAPPPAAVRDAMRAALPVAAARGVAGVHDKDGHRGAPERFAELADELTLRVHQSVPIERLHDGTGARYVKAFMDGTLGSRTARLLDGTGVQITSREGLEEIISEAAAHGLPVAVHAIGDLANREALDAFENTRDEWRGLRPRIEHAQCVHPDDVPRFARLGVAASVQYTHATSDRELAARIWADRLDHAYPYAQLHAAGALLAGGSDAPVEELDPLAGLQAATEQIPIEAALASFTTAPAWLSGDEQRRGRLAPGFDADVVVLDRDPVTCPPAELTGIEVLATYVGGRRVHG